MTECVVITCASGNIGSRLVPLFYNDPAYTLRLIVSSEKSLHRLQEQYPNAEVISADLIDAQAVHQFLVGATTLFYIAPPFHPHETGMGYVVIDAAVKAGIKHFVYSSVIQSQLRKLLNHDCKRYVEEFLFESGLDYTVLQPTHFMETFPTVMLMKQEGPVTWPALYDPETAFSFVALCDYVEVAAKVIKERDQHIFATYYLVSTLPMTYTEVVESVSKQIGREIKVERKSLEEAADMMATMSYGTKNIDLKIKDSVERMLLYYNSRGIRGHPGVLEWLLGRKATSREDLTRSQLEAAGGR